MDVHKLISRAFWGSWQAMGFLFWDAWIDEKFRSFKLRPLGGQSEGVRQSTLKVGVSVRAISKAMDLSRGTVQRAPQVEASQIGQVMMTRTCSSWMGIATVGIPVRWRIVGVKEAGRHDLGIVAVVNCSGFNRVQVLPAQAGAGNFSHGGTGYSSRSV